MHFHALCLGQISACTLWRVICGSMVVEEGPERCYSRLSRCVLCVDVAIDYYSLYVLSYLVYVSELLALQSDIRIEKQTP